MRVKVKLLNIVLILVVLVLLSVAVFAAVNSNPLSELDDKITSGLNDDGEVRVLIKFKEDSNTKSNDFNERKDAIANKREQLISDLEDKFEVKEFNNVNSHSKNLNSNSNFGINSKNSNNQNSNNQKTDIEVTHNFETINGISAKVTDQTVLEELVNNDLVEEIYYDYPIAADLSTSVPQINADDNWAFQIGGVNITGLGETVCVVDTGIDYTHPALGGCNPVTYSTSGTVENLSAPVESAHNYTNSYDNTWTINKTGYGQIAIHFVNISLESPGGSDTTDRVYVYDANNNTIAVYKGDSTNVWSPYADGDTIYVRLVTDGSITDYGFYIDQVINGTTNTTMNWSSCSKVIGGYDLYNNDSNPVDDNGHGTHVAGIVASTNDTYKGVAPDAKLAAVKVLSSSGSGYSSDAAAGIDWCTSNADRLNISVISMSLGCNGGGCTHYQTACTSDLTNDAVNTAYSQNISVVIAAGNSGWTDGISNPACVANATPVGAVNSADSIFYNRGDLLKLLAPGVNIVSTEGSSGSTCGAPGGAFGSCSGTSMSTPHVSGAIALFNQYWRLAYNDTARPNQIENKFFITGKLIDDTSNSGNNYTRIDAQKALQPYINFTSATPANNTETNLSTVNINITSDVALTSAFLEWNYSNGTKINYSMGLINSTYFNYTIIGLTSSTYAYKVYGNDSVNNFGVSAQRIIVVNLPTNEVPNITITTPQNNSYHNTYFSLNISVSDANLSTSNYTITNSSGTIIQSAINGSITVTNITWTDLVNVSNSSFADDNYTLTVFATDPTNTSSSAVNFVVDKTAPSIFALTILPATIYNNDSVAITVNVTDTYLNSSLIYLESNFTGTLINYTMNLQSGDAYNYSITAANLSNQENVTYQIYAQDLAGNINSSSQQSFKVANRAPSLVNITSPANNSVVEVGNSTQFNLTATDPDSDSLTYQWSWDDGSSNSTSQNPTHTYNSTGTYNITVTASDPYSSSLSSAIQVIVNDTTAPTVSSISYDSSVHIVSDVNQSVDVTASDFSNISSIKLYYNNSVKTKNSSTSTSATWTWGNFTVGNYNFTIELIDNSTQLNARNHTYNFSVVSCSDGAKNGDETAVDCGGSCSACTTTTTTSSSGGGGGGGGSGGGSTTTTTLENETELISSTQVPESIATSDSSAAEDSISTASDNKAKTTIFTRQLDLISGQEATLTLEEPSIPVKDIKFISKKNVTINVTVKNLESLPSGASSIKGPYQFLEIDLNGATNDDLEKAYVSFDVEKAWLAENSYSSGKVKFWVLEEDGNWKKQSLSINLETEDVINYQAKVDHFSTFVITGEESSNIFGNVIGALTSFSWFKTGLSKKQNLIILLSIFVVILVSLYFLLRPKEE